MEQGLLFTQLIDCRGARGANSKQCPRSSIHEQAVEGHGIIPAAYATERLQTWASGDVLDGARNICKLNENYGLLLNNCLLCRSDITCLLQLCQQARRGGMIYRWWREGGREKEVDGVKKKKKRRKALIWSGELTRGHETRSMPKNHTAHA